MFKRAFYYMQDLVEDFIAMVLLITLYILLKLNKII